LANAYTDISSGLSLGVNLVKTAYDRLVEFNLRSVPQFRVIADKRPAQQAMPGDSVVMQFYQDLAPQTATLTETVDPDAVAVPTTSTVTVTLAEYGSTVLVTRRLRLFALSDVDPAVADIVAFQMADSIDRIVRDVLRGGTNVLREIAGAMVFGGTTATVTATDTLKSRDIRASVTRLRGRNAIPRVGDLFVHYMHPDQSYDLRSETDPAG
jgi:N4-gp56 family major capsid protein